MPEKKVGVKQAYDYSNNRWPHIHVYLPSICLFILTFGFRLVSMKTPGISKTAAYIIISGSDGGQVQQVVSLKNIISFLLSGAEEK